MIKGMGLATMMALMTGAEAARRENQWREEDHKKQKHKYMMNEYALIQKKESKLSARKRQEVIAYVKSHESA